MSGAAKRGPRQFVYKPPVATSPFSRLDRAVLAYVNSPCARTAIDVCEEIRLCDNPTLIVEFARSLMMSRELTPGNIADAACSAVVAMRKRAG